MGTVSAGAAMSLDGFIADPSGDVGPLFDWYFNGDVEFPTVGGRWVFKTSEASAKHLREIWNSAGALVVGRGEVRQDAGLGRPPPARRPGVRPHASAAGRVAVPGDSADGGRTVHVRHRRHRERDRSGAGDRGGQGRRRQPGVDRGADAERGAARRGVGRAGARAARRRHPVLRRGGEAAGAVREPTRDRGGRGDAPDLHDQARA
jgi:hypothetical protein